MLLKFRGQYARKFGKLSSDHRTRKDQFSFQSQKKGSAKECSNFQTIVLISHTSKVMLKILQALIQQYVTQELPEVQGGFRKGSGTRDQIANLCCLIEKIREFQKNIYFCFTDYAKVFDCVDHKKLLWKTLQELGISDHFTWETCMQVKKQQLQLDMGHRMVQNWERSMTKLYIVTLLI